MRRPRQSSGKPRSRRLTIAGNNSCHHIVARVCSPNGAGQQFTFLTTDTASQKAQKARLSFSRMALIRCCVQACEALAGVGKCVAGSCGPFSYWLPTRNNTGACTCAQPVGSYEFVYANAGGTSVGQDLGTTSSASVSRLNPYRPRRVSRVISARSARWCIHSRPDVA